MEQTSVKTCGIKLHLGYIAITIYYSMFLHLASKIFLRIDFLETMEPVVSHVTGKIVNVANNELLREGVVKGFLEELYKSTSTHLVLQNDNYITLTKNWSKIKVTFSIQSMNL